MEKRVSNETKVFEFASIKPYGRFLYFFFNKKPPFFQSNFKHLACAARRKFVLTVLSATPYAFIGAAGFWSRHRGALPFHLYGKSWRPSTQGFGDSIRELRYNCLNLMLTVCTPCRFVWPFGIGRWDFWRNIYLK